MDGGRVVWDGPGKGARTGRQTCVSGHACLVTAHIDFCLPRQLSAARVDVVIPCTQCRSNPVRKGWWRFRGWTPPLPPWDFQKYIFSRVRLWNVYECSQPSPYALLGVRLATYDKRVRVLYRIIFGRPREIRLQSRLNSKTYWRLQSNRTRSHGSMKL